jgi:RNA polymerase sigma factor (sigma-70 family)
MKALKYSDYRHRMTINMNFKPKGWKKLPPNNLTVAERQALVLSVIGLVYTNADKFTGGNRFGRHEQLHEDLVQAGTLGAVQASQTFQPDRGCKFTTYAMFYIRERMHTFMTHEQTPFGYRSSSERDNLPKTSSISASIGKSRFNSQSMTIADIVSFDGRRDREDIEQMQQAEAALRILTPLQRQVYVMRYRDGLKLHEIGKELFRAKNSISEILRTARTKLADWLAEQQDHATRQQAA